MRKYLGVLLALVLAFSLVAVALPAQPAKASPDWTNPDWWDPDWTYRQELQFQNSAQSSAVTDFPVLVTLVSGVNFDYTHANANGYDLRFINDDGTTVLPYEIEEWNYGGTSLIWVKVDTIENNDIDYIHMYYGNSAITTDSQNAAGVWNPFVGVWHLNDTSGTTVVDSTGVNDGTRIGATMGASGQINNAFDFDGTNDYIALPADCFDGITEEITVMAWVYPHGDSDGSADRRIVSATGGTGRKFVLAWDRAYVGEIGRYFTVFDSVDSRYFVNDSDTLSGNNWYMITAVYDKSDLLLYQNDAVENTKSIGVITLQNHTNATIGASATPAELFDGIIDEVRISDTARSADWIAAQFLSMTDDYIEFGVEEATGTIIIEKDTDPTTDWDFYFTIDVSPTPHNFTLNEDMGPVSETLFAVPVGTYVVTEAADGQWDLTDIDIIESVTVNSGYNIITRTATINLEAEEIVTVTFENTAGSITIVKDVVPGEADQEFDFTGDLGGFSLDDDGVGDNFITVFPVASGAYDVTESWLAGWRLIDIEFVESDTNNSTGDVGTGTATIILEVGEDVTVTFTNRSAVGGEVYAIDKTALLMPWLALAVVLILIIGGGALFVRMRRTQ